MTLADDAATTAPRHAARPKLLEDTRFRITILTVSGAVTAALGVAASDSWPIALLIAALIVATTMLGLFVARRLTEQDEKLVKCEEGHDTCKKELHTRDVLLGMFTVAMRPTDHGGSRQQRQKRRETDHAPPLEQAFRRVLGERAEEVINQARSLLAVPDK